MKLVDRRVFIDAPPTAVYELLTDAELLAEWIAPVVCADPRPGGGLRWTHEHGDTMVGAYLELVADRRVVFTFGWEREDIGAPAGSTTVAIDLRRRRAAPMSASCTAVWPGRWPTPTAVGGTTTCIGSPPSPKGGIPDPTCWPEAACPRQTPRRASGSSPVPCSSRRASPARR